MLLLLDPGVTELLWLLFTVAPSGAPSNVTAIAINSTSIGLSWLPPMENQHNGDIRHYAIRVVELHTGREFQLTSTYTTIIYSQLHPAYTYNFSVAAVTVETGPYSDPVVTTTPEDGIYRIVCIPLQHSQIQIYGFLY